MSPTPLRPYLPTDHDWLVDLHGRVYAQEEGFDESFPILVDQILTDFEMVHDLASERGFVAQDGQTRLGSIFCVRSDATTAKLRLFVLAPEARGRGLGRQMLSACMDFARQSGYMRMVLWTHESHRAACALYHAAGWRITSSRPVRNFGVDLVEQAWEITL